MELDAEGVSPALLCIPRQLRKRTVQSARGGHARALHLTGHSPSGALSLFYPKLEGTGTLSGSQFSPKFLPSVTPLLHRKVCEGGNVFPKYPEFSGKGVSKHSSFSFPESHSPGLY